MRDYDFSSFPGGPALGRGVQIHSSKTTKGQYNVMVYHRDGLRFRVYGPTDLADAKHSRDEVRLIIDAACAVANQPTVHGRE